MTRVAELLIYLSLVACVSPLTTGPARHTLSSSSGTTEHASAGHAEYCCGQQLRQATDRPNTTTLTVVSATISSAGKRHLPAVGSSPTLSSSLTSETPALQIKSQKISRKIGSLRFSSSTNWVLSSQGIERIISRTSPASGLPRLFTTARKRAFQFSPGVVNAPTASKHHQPRMDVLKAFIEPFRAPVNYKLHVTSTIPLPSLDGSFKHANNSRASNPPINSREKLGRGIPPSSMSSSAYGSFQSRADLSTVSHEFALAPSSYVPDILRESIRASKTHAASCSHLYGVVSFHADESYVAKRVSPASYEPNLPSSPVSVATAQTPTSVYLSTMTHGRRPTSACETSNSSRRLKELLLLIGAGAFPGLVVVCLLTMYISGKVKERKMKAARRQANSTDITSKRPPSAGRTLTPSNSFCSLTDEAHLQMDISNNRSPSVPQIIVTPTAVPGTDEMIRLQKLRNSYGGRRSERIVQGTDISIRRASSFQLSVRPANCHHNRNISWSLAESISHN